MPGKPRGSYRSHVSKEIKRLDGEERLCPNSLREVLNHVRETADDGAALNHVAYARALDRAWQGPRYGVDKISKAIFETTEDGNHTVAYWHLEAYARELGIPSGLLLMFSRLHAEMSNNTGEEARNIANAVCAALTECEQSIATTGHFDLRRAVHTYLNANSERLGKADAHQV